MKILQKYFLALVPPPEIAEKANEIKLSIRDQFGIKYALKSPPHVTVKMPFSHNEAKETLLVEKLGDFLKIQKPFTLKIDGVGSFGKRVIFLSVENSPELVQFQSSLKTFCKKELNLIDELSDRNYHPHLTVAFKDIKVGQFDKVLELVKRQSFHAQYFAESLQILKRIDKRWVLHKNVHLGD